MFWLAVDVTFCILAGMFPFGHSSKLSHYMLMV